MSDRFEHRGSRDFDGLHVVQFRRRKESWADRLERIAGEQERRTFPPQPRKRPVPKEQETSETQAPTQAQTNSKRKGARPRVVRLLRWIISVIDDKP